MEGLRALCTRYQTLLILDEVACGFGRTGKVFATEHFDIEPDIMCVAKAISGGVAGMGAMLAMADVGETMKEKLQHRRAVRFSGISMRQSYHPGFCRRFGFAVKSVVEMG